MASVKVNCMRCRHYFVTWNPKFPRGCRAYGFKCKSMPSMEVLRTSGMPCMQYEKKATR